MFERYSDQARRAVFFARYEASQFGSRSMEPHHMLLGLLREQQQLFEGWLKLPEDAERMRRDFEQLFPAEEPARLCVDLPVGPELRRVLAYAAEETGGGTVEPVHLLIGVLREEGSAAAGALRRHGITLETVRALAAGGVPSRPARPEERGSEFFHRFTEAARRSVFFARYEAGAAGSREIESHHLLLGILREHPPVLQAWFGSPADFEWVRKEVERRFPAATPAAPAGDMPLSLECRQALALAPEESCRLAHTHIGTEHLLLGLLRMEESVGAQLLRERGVTLEALRDAARAGQ